MLFHFFFFFFRIIFKCSCETVFKKKQLLLEHFHQNASKRVTSVFKCPECNSVFPQKHLLMQHFKVKLCVCVCVILSCKMFFFLPPDVYILQSVHIGNMTAEAENGNVRKNGKEWRRNVHSSQQKKSHSPAKQAELFKQKAEQDSRARAKPTGWTCGECLQWFPERDSYVSHVKTAHTKVRGHEFLMLECVCSVRSKSLSRSKSIAQWSLEWRWWTCEYTKKESREQEAIFKLSVQQSVKKYTCRHCEQSFNSRNGLRRHNRTTHDGKKRTYTCW